MKTIKTTHYTSQMTAHVRDILEATERMTRNEQVQEMQKFSNL
jgi:hypothetical protein